MTITMPKNFGVDEAGNFRIETYKMVDTGTTELIIDFKDCEFIDSTGLGVLVGLYKKMQERNGTVKLKSLNEDIMRLIKMTRLDHIFTIID